jgi:predicted transcriptional regulator of viral defense system
MLEKKKKYHKITKPIMQLLSTFCYQTAFEILITLERKDDDIDPNSVLITLCRLEKEGRIVSRLTQNPYKVRRVWGHTKGKLMIKEYVRAP